MPTIYELACEGNLESLKKRVEEGANIHATTYGGKTVLHAAAKSGNLDLVQYLVDRGADDSDCTALKYAVWAENLELVQYFVEKGTDVYTPPYDNRPTFLECAAWIGNLELVQYLVEKGLDIHAQTRDGKTVLHFAAASGNFKMVQYLVEKGADVHTKSRDGETVLHHTICRSFMLYHNSELVQYLVERGVDIHAKDWEGRTALHIAAHFVPLHGKADCQRALSLFEYFLNKGADINAVAKDARFSWMPAGCFKAARRKGDIILEHFKIGRRYGVTVVSLLILNAFLGRGHTDMGDSIFDDLIKLIQYFLDRGFNVGLESMEEQL